MTTIIHDHSLKQIMELNGLLCGSVVDASDLAEVLTEMHESAIAMGECRCRPDENGTPTCAAGSVLARHAAFVAQRNLRK